MGGVEWEVVLDVIVRDFNGRILSGVCFCGDASQWRGG